MKTKASFLLVCGLLLTGCGTTGYMEARQEEQVVRELAVSLPSELPPPPQANCIKKKINERQAGASNLTIAVSQMSNKTVSPQVGSGPGGTTPQDTFTLPVQDAVAELGFRVALDLEGLTKNPTQGTYILDGGLTSFTPLTKAVTWRGDIDILIPEWAREKLVARGSVTAVAVLYAPIKGKYYTWKTATSTAVFFQTKDTQKLNLAFKTGVSGGTAIETVEINAVQDVSSMVMREVAVKVIGRALGIDC